VTDKESVTTRTYPTDLTDKQWDVVRPLLVEDPHKRGRKYGGDMRLLTDALFYGAHRVPVALPAGSLSGMDTGLEPVPALVSQRHIGAGAC
jgi:hypothetical protein